MNTANGNGLGSGIEVANKCIVSYNTANDSAGVGTFWSNSFNLITHNMAVNNNIGVDFEGGCPDDVTFNTSTNGFPASYALFDSNCRTVGNQ